MDDCRCRECYGLAEYLEAIGLTSRGLPRAQGHTRLRVVTPGPLQPEETCDGSYVCRCRACSLERAQLMRQAQQRRAA